MQLLKYEISGPCSMDRPEHVLELYQSNELEQEIYFNIYVKIVKNNSDLKSTDSNAKTMYFEHLWCLDRLLSYHSEKYIERHLNVVLDHEYLIVPTAPSFVENSPYIFWTLFQVYRLLFWTFETVNRTQPWWLIYMYLYFW